MNMAKLRIHLAESLRVEKLPAGPMVSPEARADIADRRGSTGKRGDKIEPPSAKAQLRQDPG